MADRELWLLGGVALGVGIGAAAWWWTHRTDPLALGPDPIVRQTVVHRNDRGMIEAVETTNLPAGNPSGVQAAAPRMQGPGDIDVVQDGWR